jgi:hypothetical protein
MARAGSCWLVGMVCGCWLVVCMVCVVCMALLPLPACWHWQVLPCLAVVGA